MAGDRALRSAAPVGEHDAPNFVFDRLRLPVIAQVIGPDGLRQKVLSIVAPVGYGKSVLMSVLSGDLRRAGRRCLWLSLDERTTQVDSLLNGIGQQLATGDQRLLPTSQALFGGGGTTERRIETLIASLGRSPTPTTLFIDNLHFCTDPQLERLIDRLCFGTPDSVRLVISSTREIPFNRSRALLENLLRQVGPDELAFGRDEVASMFGRELCDRIGPGAVERVAQRTEGWPAAVRVAQIVLSNSRDPATALQSFTGSDEGLADLLNRHVLSVLPPGAQHFLLVLGQLRSFSPELCREITGDDQTQSYLDDLIRRNIFVIPLDRNGQWYRLHTLLREFLQRQSERLMDESERRNILLRAARWCQESGIWRDAMDYALAARALPMAAQILAAIAPWFVRKHGDARQFIDWVEALHENGHETSPQVGYWYAWALAFYRRYNDARRHIRSIEARLDAARADDAVLLRELAIMLASIDVFTDHLPEAMAGARKWLERLSSEDDPFSLTGARCIETNCYASGFDFVAARRANQSARTSAFQAQSGYASGWAAAYGGLIPIYEGNYAQAYSELLSALDAARAQFGDSGISGTLALVAARCAAEMALTPEARNLLAIGLPEARTHGFLEAVACGLEAGVEVWNGDDDPLIGLPALREIADAYPPRLACMLSCFLVRRYIELGRKDDARLEAERIGLTIASRTRRNVPAGYYKLPVMRELLAATEIELLLDAGRRKPASARVTRELAEANTEGRAGRAVDLLLIEARLASGLRAEQTRLRAMQQAIRLAASRRILRPFLRRSDLVTGILRDQPVDRWALVTAEEQTFFVDLCSLLAVETDGASPAATAAESGSQPVLERLTPRELDMLRLIEAGLRNQQIADRLGVSLTTTKWHLRNLYTKLDVSTRSAALARAKSAKLV